MSFNRDLKQGLVRSLKPIMIKHNGDGTSDFFIDGQFSGKKTWSGWIKLIETTNNDVVSAIEIYDSSGEIFYLGLGEEGLEQIEIQIPAGGNGLIPLEFINKQILSIKCLGTPAQNTYMIINFYKPTELAVTGDRGYPAVFDGEKVKVLKNKLSLADRAHLIAGEEDPRVVGVNAPISSLYFKGDPLNPTIYIKQGDEDKNWKIISSDEVLTKLGDLKDVSIEGIQDGEVLSFDAASGKWIPAQIVEPIRRPKFISMDENIPASGIFKITEFRSIYPTEEHIKTKLQVATSPKFLPSELVINYESTTPVYEVAYLLPQQTTFWVRCKFISTNLESRWSSYRLINTTPWIVLKPKCYISEYIPKFRKITPNNITFEDASMMEKSIYLFIGDDQGSILGHIMQIGLKE